MKASRHILLIALVGVSGYLRAADPNIVTVKSTAEFTHGTAVWYRVPPNSLARRRAKATEFTAAHNHLPLGTLVRVTRLSNGEQVIVRITDRGITNRHGTIDLCKEAAQRLGMVRAGVVRVSLEVIPESELGSSGTPNEVAAQ